MIAVFLDFYLDKSSPLQGFSEKKFTIGSRYAPPPAFNPLLSCV